VNRYVSFDSASYNPPNVDWTPPYPYCSEDVLFPVEYQDADIQIADKQDRFPFAVISEAASLEEQLITNDSLGG